MTETIMNDETIPIGTAHLNALLKVLENNKDSPLTLAANPKLTMSANPKLYWLGGELEDMTNDEAYAEFITNIFDKNKQHNPNHDPINLYLYATEKGKGNLDSIVIEDDGPMPSVLNSFEGFLDTVLQLAVVNKKNNDDETIGEAGMGAKDAAAFFGAKHTWEWSVGNNNPHFKIWMDEKSFTSWTSFHSETVDENYEGKPFFKLTIENIRDGVQPPSKLRNKIGERFSEALKTHPNINIYTSRPNTKTSNSGKILPIDPVDFDPDLPNGSGSINHFGNIINWQIGVDKNSYDYRAIIRKHGVIISNKIASPALKKLILKNNGDPAKLDNFYRGMTIILDYNKWKATKIKNNLVWDNSSNVEVFNVLNEKSEINKISREIQAHFYKLNNNNKVIELPKGTSDKIDKLLEEASGDIAELLNGSEDMVTNFSFQKPKKGQKKTTYKAKSTKKDSRKNGKQDSDIRNGRPKVVAGGKSRPLELSWVEDKDLSSKRSWIDEDEKSITITINQAWEGYTNSIDRDKTQKMPLFVAETVGHTLHVEGLRKKILNKEISLENFTDLTNNTNLITAKYLKIVSNEKV